MQIAPLGSAALSGLHAGLARLGNVAHNVANVATEGARRLDTEQVARAEGGVDVRTRVGEEGIDLAEEAVDGIRGRTQVEVSLRTLAVDQRVHDTLIDILA